MLLFSMDHFFFLLQVHVTDAEKKESLLLNKKRRKMILHNKAPMWNEASQVCNTKII